MRIIKVAVGNKEEAFIEYNFSSALNIISSDDNNKGKTIVIQSMMYALGNEPTFPTSFEYRTYYYYVEYQVGDVYYKLCRFLDSFVLKHDTNLMLFDNVSELKRYWNKNIFPIPSIIKNGVSRIADPVLFMQLFFVGQDKKDTSNIAHHSFYNKQDFIEMLYSYMKLGNTQLTQDECDQLKNKITVLTDERKMLLQQHKILKSKKTPATYLSKTSDRLAFGEKVSNLEKVQEQITELRKARNLTLTRKSKWESTIKELRSLNKTIASGELRCMDCNSTNISFSTNNHKPSYSFDVSTVEMRNEIIASINEKISSYSEEIEKLSADIAVKQNRMQELMEDETISLESIVAYKQEVFSASDAEKRISEIEDNLSILRTQLLSSENASAETQQQRAKLLTAIIDKMNALYKKIDPKGNIVYNSLFTHKNEVYSGSEATVFHLVRLMAFQSITKHNFPIIIDSFRAEDLSTMKENVVIELAKSIDNQIIFTTTLKAEEYGKYDSLEGVNHIDYRKHSPSKILIEEFVADFKALLLNLAIDL